MIGSLEPTSFALCGMKFINNK